MPAPDPPSASSTPAARARYRYKHLDGYDLEFGEPHRRGPVQFRYGDLTATDYPSAAFGAIACLSVIEHGVDLIAYFKEMARLLRPGGTLVTSTDFWSEPIDTTDLVAHGTQVRVFTPADITNGLKIAKSYGLEPIGPLDLTCEAPVVTWARLASATRSWCSPCTRSTERPIPIIPQGSLQPKIIKRWPCYRGKITDPSRFHSCVSHRFRARGG